jgi:tetratricopeptide (TPR) repeat protein
MKLILYILVFLFGTASFAQNTAAFSQANALYNDGNYTEALSRYKSILEQEEHSAELYYNIANAHYKLNNVAPSIYYYEKALLLKPNDKEILNNIAYAKNMTIDAIEIIPEVGFSRLINKATNTMVFDNWAKLSVIFVVPFAFNSYGLEQKNQPAIVFAQESQIKSEPNLRSAEAFKLHEGTKVQVIDTVSNWSKIKLSDGKTGWVVSNDIKMLKTF